MEQDVGTVDPMYMRDHGIKGCGGDILKPQMHLYGFVKKFHRPPQRVPNQDLSGLECKVRAGKVFALSSGSTLSFRAYQLNRCNIFEPNDGMSDAELLPPFSWSVRSETNSFPSKPALSPEKILDLAPALFGTGLEVLSIGFNGSSFLYSHDEIPSSGEDDFLNSLIIVAGVSKHNHFLGFVVFDVFRKIQRLEVVYDPFVLALVLQILLSAVIPAQEGNRKQRNDHVIYQQHDVGPLMANKVSLAVIVPLDIFRVQAGSALAGQINQHGHLPWEFSQCLHSLGVFLSLPPGKILECVDGRIRMLLEQPTELRTVLSRNCRGMLQRVLSSGYHKGDDVPQADPLQAFAHVEFFEQPVSKNVEPHFLSSAVIKMGIPLKYGGGIRSTNSSAKKLTIYGSYTLARLQKLTHCGFVGRREDLAQCLSTFQLSWFASFLQNVYCYSSE